MSCRRSGLRIVGARGNPQIRRALIRFARWLRTEFGFPIRVPVYLLTRERVRTIDGRLCTASFFAPFSRKDDPHIRIATADWSSAGADQGRDNALAGYLCSLAKKIFTTDSGSTGSR